MASRISFRDLFDASGGNWNDRFFQTKEVVLGGKGQGEEFKNSRSRESKNNTNLAAEFRITPFLSP